MKLPRWASALAVFGLLATAGCAPHGGVACATAQAPDTPGGPFNLVDQDGKAVDQRVLNGKWSVVFFGYTFCPDFCPTTLTTLGRAMDVLGPKAKEVQVVFITIDPARDTPAALKTYLSSRVFPRNMLGLTGTPAQIANVAKRYVVFYQKEGTGPGYSMDHSTALYLMDPCGKFHSVIADGLTPDQDAQAISDAMRGA
ncbi:MAG TPA: SCO family protein [Caulobacteraceae bacterium]